MVPLDPDAPIPPKPHFPIKANGKGMTMPYPPRLDRHSTTGTYRWSHPCLPPLPGWHTVPTREDDE